MVDMQLDMGALGSGLCRLRYISRTRFARTAVPRGPQAANLFLRTREVSEIMKNKPIRLAAYQSESTREF
jgi:hypothetical protein